MLLYQSAYWRRSSHYCVLLLQASEQCKTCSSNLEGEIATDGSYWCCYYDRFDHLIHTRITVWWTNPFMEKQSSHWIARRLCSPSCSLHTLGDLSKRTRDDCPSTGMLTSFSYTTTTITLPANEYHQQFLERHIWVGSLYMFFFGGAYFVLLYYLPIYFQSIHSASPINSGVRMLALIIPLTLAAIVQGFALSKIGIVPLFWIIGGAIATIGAGLMYTFDAGTSAGKWIGYQILVGFATGATFQVAIANAQVHAKAEDLSQVSAIINCKSASLLLPAPIPPHRLSDSSFLSLRDHRRRLLHLCSAMRIQQHTYLPPLQNPCWHQSSNSPRYRSDTDT